MREEAEAERMRRADDDRRAVRRRRRSAPRGYPDGRRRSRKQHRRWARHNDSSALVSRLGRERARAHLSECRSESGLLRLNLQKRSRKRSIIHHHQRQRRRAISLPTRRPKTAAEPKRPRVEWRSRTTHLGSPSPPQTALLGFRPEGTRRPQQAGAGVGVRPPTRGFHQARAPKRVEVWRAVRVCAFGGEGGQKDPRVALCSARVNGRN